MSSSVYETGFCFNTITSWYVEFHVLVLRLSHPEVESLNQATVTVGLNHVSKLMVAMSM